MNIKIFLMKNNLLVAFILVVALMGVKMAFAETVFFEDFGNDTEYSNDIEGSNDWIQSDTSTSGVDDRLSRTGGSDGNLYVWIQGVDGSGNGEQLPVLEVATNNADPDDIYGILLEIVTKLFFRLVGRGLVVDFDVRVSTLAQGAGEISHAHGEVAEKGLVVINDKQDFHGLPSFLPAGPTAIDHHA